jgi:hypothetical protein
MNLSNEINIPKRRGWLSAVVLVVLGGNAAVAGEPGGMPLLRQMRPDTHVSHAGIGSLYWAVSHSENAWRVFLPIRTHDGSGASEELREQCAVFAGPPSSRIACP